MPIRIIIDTREKQLAAVMTSQKIKFTTMQLDLGDILILYSKSSEILESWNKSNFEHTQSARLLLKDTNDTKDTNDAKNTNDIKDTKDTNDEEQDKLNDKIWIFTIERKTYTDLIASIIDGRYKEQKSRYLQLPPNSVWYILECNDESFEILPRSQFLGMYTHTMVRDNIGVFRTNSLAETSDIISSIAETINKYGPLYTRQTTDELETSQIKKKKCISQHDVFYLQLTCFPGISGKKAKAIAAIYPSIEKLCTAIKDGSFKVKGIGKVLIQNIKNALFETEQTSTNKMRIQFI